jgi:hypothetical protein
MQPEQLKNKGMAGTLFSNILITNLDASIDEIKRAGRYCRAAVHPQASSAGAIEAQRLADMRACIDQTLEILANPRLLQKYKHLLRTKGLPFRHCGIHTPFSLIRGRLDAFSLISRDSLKQQKNGKRG